MLIVDTKIPAAASVPELSKIVPLLKIWPEKVLTLVA
jgi:hypothetical protein